jgi:hypothetical protein
MHTKLWVWSWFNWLRIGFSRGYCQHGNEQSCYIKWGKFLEWLNKYPILKDSSPSWSYGNLLMNITRKEDRQEEKAEGKLLWNCTYIHTYIHTYDLDTPKSKFSYYHGVIYCWRVKEEDEICQKNWHLILSGQRPPEFYLIDKAPYHAHWTHNELQTLWGSCDATRIRRKWNAFGKSIFYLQVDKTNSMKIVKLLFSSNSYFTETLR